MNFRFSFLFLFMLAAVSAFAQNRPAERFPAFIQISETTEGVQMRTSVFQKYYKMKSTDALRLIQTESDALGFRREKFQQYFKNVPVEGAVVTSHSKEGRLELLSGTYFGIIEMNVRPAISADRAFQAATDYVGAKRYLWEEKQAPGFDYKKPAGELVILVDPDGDMIPRLAYKFDIYAVDTVYRADVFIDANTGRFLQANQRIHDVNVPASGNTSYNGNRTFTADRTAPNNFRLRQTVSGSGVETYNMNNGFDYGAATDFTSTSANTWADPVGVQAHWGAEQVYNYYFLTHGRNSYDNAGSKLLSYVHRGVNFVNAFWDGSRMTYGDGDGVSFFPLVSMDICAHEITHGVTEFSAGLVYMNESGALNESFSDIFGEVIENYATGSNDWLLGDDIGPGGSGGAIRSMSNPNAFGDPDTYLGTNWFTGAGDNGGVHTNSGVQNKWFYILSLGENGTNDNGDNYCVTGIGMSRAARIAYRNLTVYLSPLSNYAAARAGAIQSARDLYGVGSEEEIATTNAWFAVGIGTAYPPIINCPANIVGVPNTPGQCSAIVLFSPTIVANCGTISLISGLPSGSAFPVGTTVNTFRVTDASGTTATCSFTVQVIDTEAPVITCPANTTVTCDTSPTAAGTATATDNCGGTPTIVFSDSAPVGDCDWLCTFTRTWTASDNALNTSSCVQTVTKSALALIEQALSADLNGNGVTDTLVLGTSNSTLTIPPGTGPCVLQWLPSPSTTASGLTFKKSVVNTGDCRPGTNPVDGNGKLANKLLEEALKLNLYVRLKPSLGTTKLNTLGCNASIKPIILQALAPNPDVNELLRVTNAALGNIALQPHLAELLEALVCINAPLSPCNL